MKKKWIAIPVAAIWVALTAMAWFGPDKAASISERRPLAQMPKVQMQSILSGKFMTEFGKYTLDQFPLRDGFRRVKAQFHQNVLAQKDNNGIYLSQGYAAKQEYPLNKPSVSHALERFSQIYERYLQDSRVVMAVVPDKGYYLAQDSGHLALDYDAMFDMVRQGMPWAEHVDLTQSLSIQDYYRTDTHWRQEKLLPVAQKLCQALDAELPQQADYTQTGLDRPFYGVYYGQAALPMEPETMYLLESPVLNSCTVEDFETGKTSTVYNWDKLDSPDLYDVYLSGARALLTIENPEAKTDRELIIFRDSFGSSLAPLLVQGYAKVTLVDIRYLRADMLDQVMDFYGQDVLFLYSTLVLNNSSGIK